MRSRGQKFSQTSEWDDDQNESVFDTQYADDTTSGNVNLDHCRLYITNIPSGLNDDGLRTAFSKFGTLEEVYLSKDPLKKYALIRYETPGEAKLAMMNMNKTEPLKLNIHIAHKSTKRGDDRPRRDWKSQSNSNRYETESIGSKPGGSRAQDTTVNDTMTNGDNTDELLEDDYGFSDIQNPKLEFELETLKMEQLKVKEEQLQCKSRMLMLIRQDKRPLSRSGPSNRCLLPDGKIIVRTSGERSADLDVNNSAGAGDSRVPALLQVRSRACVSCWQPADSYCARCGVTPYCSQTCQSKDWYERHRAVCHNLARFTDELDGRNAALDPEPSMPSPAPLRRPHVVTGPSQEEETNTHDKPRQLNRTSYQDKRDLSTRNRNNNTRNSNEMRPKTKNFNQRRQNEAQNNNSDMNEARPVVNKEPVANVEVKPVVKPVVQPVAQPVVTPVAVRKPAAVPAPVPKSPQMNSEKQTPQVVKPNPPVVKPGSVNDVTPTRKVIPKNYLIEQLSVGDSVVLSVDAKASDCKSPVGDYVCLSMHEKFEFDYQLLIENFNVDCDADPVQHKPIPGETCAFFNAEDSGWYRVRCLNPTTVAFIDGSRVVSMSATDRIRKLPAKYESMPEYCCVLESPNAEVGANLTASLVSKLGDKYKVSLTNVETGGSIGDGFLYRWAPPVEYATVRPAYPEVPRPPLSGGSLVLLVHAGQRLAYVRPADTARQETYDDIVQNVLLAGMKATPLQTPPVPGQVVITKFTDGLHYRAMVKRTQYAQNKYMLEYIDFGNSEIQIGLDKIYPCPPNLDLRAIPTQVSMIKLTQLTPEEEKSLEIKKSIDNKELEPPAMEYVDKLKDSNEEMILSLPDGEATAPSGSLAFLKLVKNNEDVNKKILGLCAPDWQKFLDQGGDVVDIPRLLYTDLEHNDLPPGPIELDILDVSVIQGGMISGAIKGSPHTDYVFNTLTQKMAEYCNSELGREPYLPHAEELCIAQCPPYPQWFRAVMAEQPAGPGGATARVCYIDYGNVEEVPVTLLRKMLPEFMRGIPVVPVCLEIADFPAEPTPDQVLRAIQYLQINDDGRGTLRVSRTTKLDAGLYQAHAPDLIRAMLG